MEQKSNYQTQEYKYGTMGEMMGHIATMGAAGWKLIYSSHLTFVAIYQKDLP